MTGTRLAGTRPRLLYPGPAGLIEHTARYGPPLSGLSRPQREALIAEVDRAGLTGRGGAGFPTARKLAAVAAAGHGAVRLVRSALRTFGAELELHAAGRCSGGPAGLLPVPSGSRR